MSGDIMPYTDLVTSEHRNAPKFLASLAAVLQPLADAQEVLRSITAAFDLDTSVGAQEDVVGEWVGRSRNVTEPLTGIYFSFDDAAVGFDTGAWFGPYDPTSGLVVLPDEPYRTVLRFQIAANNWDGSVPDADRAYREFFKNFPPGLFTVLVQDRQDMSIDLALTGGTPDALTLALFTSDENRLVPAGVRLGAFIFQTVTGTPFFGFDADTDVVAGFDTGGWGELQFPES